MQTREIDVDTSDRRFVDLTPVVVAFCEGNAHGLVNVFVPHATAGLIVMEIGSGSEEDLRAAIDRVLPRGESYVHAHGSPGHGADHLLPMLLSPSVVIPVVDGSPALGRWQSVVLVDLNVDNPKRKVRLSFIAGSP